MKIKAVIGLPGLLPGLNGSDGFIRSNRWKAGKVKESLYWKVREATKGIRRIDVPVCAVLERRYSRIPMDWDNAASSFKHLLDAIVKCGIITDDSPKYITKITCVQTKVEKKALERMIVTFYTEEDEQGI